MNGKGLPTGLRWSIILSALLHVAVATAVLVAGSVDSRSQKPPEKVITAKLLKLGKQRPEDLLPRLPRAPPPPPPAQVALPAPEAAPAVPPKPAPPKPEPEPKAPSATERLRELDRVSDALTRLKSAVDEPPEGHASGVREGTETRLSDAVAGNLYATEIYRCLKDNYNIEGIPPERVAGRKALVAVRVKADGTFIDSRIFESSGLAAFDRAVERAVRQCGKVSPPPPGILERVRDDGIEIEFTP